MQKFLLLFLSICLLAVLPQCKSNKMPCPTYADSQPQKKTKPGKQQPQIPKATKPKSGLLPPNAKKRKK